MKRRIIPVITMLLVLALCAGAMAACVNTGCSATVYTSFQGFTNPVKSTHKYGGVLGVFQGTCTVTTIYSIYSYTCGNGHNNGIYTPVYSAQHSHCGQ